MNKRNRLTMIIFIMLVLLAISVFAQNRELNISNPKTWIDKPNWNSLNSNDLASLGALEIVKKATKQQAESYFDGKLPSDVGSLSSEEKILLKKIYPKVDDDVLSIKGVIINNKDDSIEMPDGTKLFGINHDLDITMTKNGIKFGDSILISGSASINSDGSINLHQNSKLKNKYATVKTNKLPVTIFSKESEKNIESTIIFNEEYKHLYINGRGLEIQLNDDQNGWNFEAGKSIDSPSSYILNREGEKVIEINQKGLISTILGVTGETGFDFGVDAVGNVQNFISVSGGPGFCCNDKPSPIITINAIKSVL